MATLRYPPSIQWEVTSNCNHNCIHCYNYWRKDEEIAHSMNTSFPEEHYMKIAKKIVEQHPVSVVVTGGEPLLVFHKVKAAIRLLRKNGIEVSFNTNATIITDEIIEFLKENKMGLFISFPCCIPEINDFITSTDGSFKRLVKKLDIIYANKIPFTTNMVVSKANINYVESTAKFLKDRYHVSRISITRVGKPVNSTDWFDQFLLSSEDVQQLLYTSLHIKKTYGIEVTTACPFTPCSIPTQEIYDIFGEVGICTAGKTTYAIDTEGNVKACPRDGTLYGNILEEDFPTIWERTKSWRDGTLIPESCKTCNKIGSCFGGCRVGAFPTTGRMDLPDVICNPKNVPVKFDKPRTTPFTLDDKFEFDKKLKFLKDNVGTRVSANRRYIYARDNLYDFIIHHPVFTLREVVDELHTDENMANILVKHLTHSTLAHKL